MKFKKSFIMFILSLSLIFTSCTLPGIGADANEDIVIASGSNTERLILGEIDRQ